MCTDFIVDGEFECQLFNDDADISWDDFTAYFMVKAARAVSVV